MLKKMWMRLPCRKIAVSTVHHQPCRSIGPFVMPSAYSASWPGDSRLNSPPEKIEPGSSTSDPMKSTTHATMIRRMTSNWRPKKRWIRGAAPYSPGRHAPQNGQRSSLTLMSLPHDGHSIEPRLDDMPLLYLRVVAASHVSSVSSAAGANVSSI